ncbi:MAG TPA: carotenoid biosynthesis protein [Vicinamibacteria bacterium]|nr:carotenoid biosynthesis protein [Vicinamibacteria bacterium]
MTWFPAEQIAGTVALRPYVFAFLAAYLALAARDLGCRGAAALLAWGTAVAFAAEYASTRVGVPFGLYHYTGDTRGAELFLSNVPAFDSLSFPFLAYAAWCVARWARPGAAPIPTVAAAGLLMMLLDVVIDPLAVRGDRWFLGRVFYYPAGGVYFGVPLSNFVGWVLVGWAIVGGYVAAGRAGAGRAALARRGPPGLGVLLYYSILAFNLVMTAWIGEPILFAAGILIHGAVFLLLWTVRSGRGEARTHAPCGVLGRPG